MTPTRRRVLFTSYWISPRSAIGTIRSGHILRYLPQFGWEVDAVTAHFNGQHPPGGNVRYTQTGYWDLKGGIKQLAGIGDRSTSHMLSLPDRRANGKRSVLGSAVRFAADLVTYPDEYVGWLPFATHAVRRLLSSGKYDALLTSSPPVTTNVIAALAHGGVPWIADLRDLWAEDDSSDHSFMRTVLDRKLERATLSRAAMLVASSDLSAERFRRRYPGKPCHAISTGYEPQEWEGIEFGAETACTLLYAGTWYHGKRDPKLFFSVLRRLFDEGAVAREQLRVDFYSPCEPWLVQMVEEHELQGVVRIHGAIDRKTVLAAERRADRLLLFSWDGATAEGIVPGKLFEYFGARRPILAIGGTPVSSVQRLLRETGAGVRCVREEEVRAQVIAAADEHRHGPRTLAADAVRFYTAERCAAAFAALLDLAADTTAATPSPANTQKYGITGKR
jgi:glycosyltransferase involved in cell wall biosynthesis